MKQATGNLWDYPAQVVVITTNGFVKGSGECVMGRGCAREARDRYPGIAKWLGGLIRQHGNRPFNLGNWHLPGSPGPVRIASFPTKHRWDQNSDLELIKDSASKLQAMAIKFDWQSVVLPRPGCGNGGLYWADVYEAIEPLLDDRFTVITHAPIDDYALLAPGLKRLIRNTP